MFGENRGEHEQGPKKTPEYYGAIRSPERSVELGGVGSPERKAGVSAEQQEAMELLGYDYDPTDPQAQGDSENAAMAPYKVGEEYGFDVYYYPQKSWFVLQAPLPSVFYLDEQKLEVARRYPNYELVYYFGSQVLVRKEPFANVPPVV
jgi:hypothetical protein